MLIDLIFFAIRIILFLIGIVFIIGLVPSYLIGWNQPKFSSIVYLILLLLEASIAVAYHNFAVFVLCLIINAGICIVRNIVYIVGLIIVGGTMIVKDQFSRIRDRFNFLG